MQTNCFGSKYDILSACVTLKMGSRSPKPTPFLRLSRWCIHASMVRIHRLFFQVKCRKNSILQSKSWWPWKLSQGHQIVIMSFANPSLLYNTPSLVWIHYIIQEMLLWYSCVPCDIENRIKITKTYHWLKFFILRYTCAFLFWLAFPLTQTIQLSQKHTCHISHCGKIFKSHRIFRPSYSTFNEERNINYTFLCLS